MTVISSNSESPTSDAGPDKSRQRRTQRIVKRKRSVRLMIMRHLRRMLRPRQLFRALCILLPLAGFIYISLTNVVLEPDSSDERQAVAPNNAVQTDSVTLLANSWSTLDLELSTLWPYEADGTPADLGSGDLVTLDTAATGRSIRSTTTYVVNEGGSLWRTSKLFINDEILQDKLIDNLAQSGMDVHSVRAGTEFFVNDLGSEGLLVVIENGGDTYESHIFENKVTTSIK